MLWRLESAGMESGKLADQSLGKTAIRVLTGPAYAKVKKAPKVETPEEAKALLVKVLPQCVTP